MSKPRKMILGDGTSVWEVRIREAGRASSERRRRFGSLKEANDFLLSMTEERKKLRSGYVEVGSFYGTTFRSEAANWLSHIKLRCSPGHYRRVEHIIEDFNRNYGSLEPNKITLNLLTDLQCKLKERSARGKKSTWSNASVNRYTEAICAVLNFSASQKRIPHSPVQGFKKLPKSSPEMLFWTEEEASSFLAYASERYCDLSNQKRHSARKNYIAYLMAINTGARAAELWGLKPSDLLLDEEGSGSTIFIRRQFNAVTQDYGPLKGELSTDTDKSRHVPCGKELKEELQRLIKYNRIRSDEPLFQSVFGRPVNHDSFADKFERDVRRWGGRKIRFHDLRHTAATLMLAKGVDVKTVSEILGHEDLETTLIYVHLLGNRIKQVSDLFFIRPQKAVPQLKVVQGQSK